MEAFTNYNIELSGSQADIATATAILAEAFENESLKGRTSISISENYDVVWVTDALNIAKRIAREAPSLQELKIEGNVDAVGDGSYMDFLIEYTHRTLTVATTGWYSQYDAFYYEYEDFCERFCDEDGKPLYSEEFFEEVKASMEPYFAVEEDDDETLVAEVKLGEPKEIDPYGEDFTGDSI